MDFKPMADRVLILRDAAEERTVSGFFIPDAIQEAAVRGTIQAVGPGRVSKQGTTIPMDLAVGDRVMFAPGAGLPVKLEGADYLVLKEEEIIALVD